MTDGRMDGMTNASGGGLREEKRQMNRPVMESNSAHFTVHCAALWIINYCARVDSQLANSYGGIVKRFVDVRVSII